MLPLTRFSSHFARGAWAGPLLLIALPLTISINAGPQLQMRPASASAPVRGIYRFSSTSWSALASYGFNWVTDGGTNTNNYAGQKAAGLNGMVWLDAYDNTQCTQTITDAAITQVVRTNVSGGNSGAVYQVGDEPTTNGCGASSTYAHMTVVIHSADPTAKTWVADDQFNDPSTSHWPAGLPMLGSVDILAFDIYPCQSGPCRFDMIDLAILRIHSVGLTNWEFILQDFGPCQSWRAPTAAEVTQQFQHWQGAGALGYWIYSYDTDPTPCPGNVAGSAELQQLNSVALGPASTPEPTTPSSSAATSSSAPNSPPVPATPAASVTSSPKTVSGPPDARSRPISSPQPLDAAGPLQLTPPAVVGLVVVLVLAGLALSYGRRHFH
jgi:hypothetical protein